MGPGQQGLVDVVNAVKINMVANRTARK